jgi:hypothetical protein
MALIMKTEELGTMHRILSLAGTGVERWLASQQHARYGRLQSSSPESTSLEQT